MFWVLVVVYGAAPDSNKPAFLALLVRICDNETLPVLEEDKFNNIRHENEKNNANFMSLAIYIMCNH